MKGMAPLIQKYLGALFIYVLSFAKVRASGFSNQSSINLFLFLLMRRALNYIERGLTWLCSTAVIRNVKARIICTILLYSPCYFWGHLAHL